MIINQKYFTLLFLLFGSEFFVTFMALKDLYFPAIPAILLSIFISIVLAFLAHKSGELLAEKRWRELRLISIFLLAACLLIIVLRLKLDARSLYLAFLNLFFVGAAVALSYFRSQNRQFFQVEEKINRLKKRKNSKSERIKAYQSKYDEARQEIITGFDQNAREKVGSTIFNLEGEVGSAQEHIEYLKALKKRYLRIIETIKQNGLTGK